MSELSAPARHVPLRPHAPFIPPFHPNALEPESDHPGVWDWTPREDTTWQAAHTANAPLQAKRPLGGSEGVPETQPDTSDLLNVTLAVITGLSVAVVLTSLVKLILPRD